MCLTYYDPSSNHSTCVPISTSTQPVSARAGGLVLCESRVHFFILDQNSKLLETMNSKQKSRLNLVKIQRVCPRGVRADPGIHQVAPHIRPVDGLEAVFDGEICCNMAKKEKRKKHSSHDSSEFWGTAATITT